MNTNRELTAEAEVSTRDNVPRCREHHIYGTKKDPPGYWGVRRAPEHDDELGAEAVIVGAEDIRIVFRADRLRPEWFVVSFLPARKE